MGITQRDREVIASTLRKALGTEEVTAVIFGSQARGDAHFGSDVDIGLSTKSGEPLPPGLLADVQEAFDDSSLTQRVEVVDLARTTQTFRDEALRHTIPI